jgi:hypothetical protein
MVGCGSIILAGILIASLAVAVVSSRPRSMRATLVLLFDYEEQSILGHADRSASEQDRKEFRDAYARFRSAWLAGRLDSGDTRELRTRMMTELQKDTFRGEDLRSLARFFDRLAGGKRNPAPAPPPGSVKV